MGLARLACLGWCVLLATGCGDDDDTLEPQDLIPDPAVQTGCLPDALGAGQARAKLVACADEVPAGRLASGRVGDIVIENSKIEVVIRGFGEGFVFPGSFAGGIVDAAPLGGEDLIKEIQPLVELNGVGFDEFVITEAGDDGAAEVVVRGPGIVIPFIEAAVATQAVPALIELHYILEPDADELLLRIITFGTDGAETRVQHGEGLFFGGRVAIFVPTRGFIEGGGANGEFLATAGSDTTSYGVVYAASAAQAVQFVDIGGIVLSVGGTTSLAEPAPMDRWLVVGDGSASSITDRAWALRGTETGTISGTTAPRVAIALNDGDTPITRGRSDASGAYELSVPPGTYTVRAESIDRGAPTRDPGTDASVTVTVGGEHTVDLTAGATGTVTVNAEDDNGTPIPTRVVATKDGFRRIDWTDAAGQVQFDLAPGTYSITVSRGMEYDAFTATAVEVVDGSNLSLDAILTRVVDTDGWISMDTHLHSEMSSDSSFPLDLRLKAVAGEGVEVAVSTDHDFIVDYVPIIEEVGLTDWLATRTGEEISSLVWGHINAWPLQADYDQPAGGAIHWYHVSPGEVFSRAHDAGATVVQINHPRTGSQSGVFDAINLDPVTLTARTDPEDLGLPAGTDLEVFEFDAVEIANDFNAEAFEKGWLDWIALISAGHPAAATGSSDSHGPGAYSGNSRTYVYVGSGNDDPATVDLELVDQNTKARRVIVAQGAFVLAGVEIPGSGEVSLPGDLVDLSGQTEARIRIRVQAPPWMPLQNIEIYGPGGEIVNTINLDSGDTAAVRYAQTIVVPIDSTDTFFVVRANPAGSGSPVLGTPDASFTNPLMVDGNGDDVWTPPN